MNSIVAFILWFAAAELLLTAVQFPLRKKKPKTVVRVCLILLKALLAIVFAFLVLAGPVQLRIVQPLMTALYAALFADAIADALYRVICGLRSKEPRFGRYKALSLICGVLFLTYGVVNMETVTPRYHTYTSDKLTREHTVVFLADLHVGSAQPFSVTQKTVAAINNLHPDATVLGGDIVDDYTTKEEMEATFGLFAAFDMPVYYVYGNHDRQGYAQYAGGQKFTQEDLEAAAKENGVTVLKDEFAEIAPDLLLLGREDVSEKDKRTDVSQLVNPSPDSYLIVADHQPADFKENVSIGADLQLSGHTHAGQLFPLGALYPLIGYCSGDYAQGDAVMNVSAGACGWRLPFRTQSHCNYEVVTLQPKQ